MYVDDEFFPVIMTKEIFFLCNVFLRQLYVFNQYTYVEKHVKSVFFWSTKQVHSNY